MGVDFVVKENKQTNAIEERDREKSWRGKNQGCAVYVLVCYSTSYTSV